MKHLKYILFSFWLIACGSVQPITEETSKSIPSIDHLMIHDDVDYFEIDKFENLYYVDGNKLHMIDSQNNRNYLYENDRLGDITLLDVSNPQKILAFYEDYDIVISLDNTLSERSQIDLKRFNYTDINAVALSNDNKIWIYDPISFQLKKINERGDVLGESLNLNSTFGNALEANKIIEKENKVYLNSPSQGILIFDNLGQYLKLIPIKGLIDFQVIGQNIVYLNESGPISYSQIHFENKAISGFDTSRLSEWKQLRIVKDFYYLALANGIQKEKR